MGEVVEASRSATLGDDHDAIVLKFTGGMAPKDLPGFDGSDRLRADGRPLPEFRAELRRIADLRNAGTIVSILVMPVAYVSLYVWLDRLWLFPVAFILMGTVFPRLTIINHEAAHRLLFSNRKINDLIGEKLFGLLAFTDGGDGYRRSHAHHHRDEFGPNEPDFILYSGYPIPKDSMRRKLGRDVTGRSGWKVLKPILRGLLRSDRRRRAIRTLAPQVAIAAVFALTGHPWLYLTLWFLPWLTYWRFVNRLRAMAEHAGMTRSKDRRMTTHHIEQNWLTQFLFVPYNTGYHLAHHVDSGVPWRSLPTLHRALVEDGYTDGMPTYPNYRTFWKAAVQRR